MYKDKNVIMETKTIKKFIVETVLQLQLCQSWSTRIKIVAG